MSFEPDLLTAGRVAVTWRVDGVGAPRDPAAAKSADAPQHVLVERAAHPQRQATALQWLRVAVDLLEAQQLRVVARTLVAPERLTDLERVVEQTSAALEGEPRSFVLLLLPADACPDVEPAVRKHVERGERLGEHDRAAQRRDQDARHQAAVLRHAGDHRQQRDRLEPVAVGASWLPAARGPSDLGLAVLIEVLAEHHMVRDDESVDARSIGGAHLGEQRLPATGPRILRREVEKLDRESRSHGLE